MLLWKCTLIKYLCFEVCRLVYCGFDHKAWTRPICSSISSPADEQDPYANFRFMSACFVGFVPLLNCIISPTLTALPLMQSRRLWCCYQLHLVTMPAAWEKPMEDVKQAVEAVLVGDWMASTLPEDPKMSKPVMGSNSNNTMAIEEPLR